MFSVTKKDENGTFKRNVANDVEGLLELYEATYMRVPGEIILEDALVFTRSHLSIIAKDTVSTNPALSTEIQRALKQPLWKRLPRIEAAQYIPFYQQQDSHNKMLLKLAKLEFNLLQTLHKEELSQMSKIFFVKVLAIVTVIDDTYDAYGTYEELKIFTEAIQRCSMDELVCYRCTLDVQRMSRDAMVELSPRAPAKYSCPVFPPNTAAKYSLQKLFFTLKADQTLTITTANRSNTPLPSQPPTDQTIIMVLMVPYEAFACPCGAGDVVLREAYKPWQTILCILAKTLSVVNFFMERGTSSSIVLLELQRLQFILQDLHRLQFILQDLQHLYAILQELQHLKAIFRELQEIVSIGCLVMCEDGYEERYSGCIIAAHAPDTPRMLVKQATYDEQRILGSFNYVYSILEECGTMFRFSLLIVLYKVLGQGLAKGSFAIELVKETECKYTGITLSEEQLSYAKAKVKEADLQNTDICLFKELVSICSEMLEAVGHEYIETFFWLFVLQFISVPEGKYDEYRNSPALDNGNFIHINTSEILALGFNENFIRTWEYYFDYCAAGLKPAYWKTVMYLSRCMLACRSI
ncbi:amorpha-4,11-diene synthase [Tanacetum coccineum]